MPDDSSFNRTFDHTSTSSRSSSTSYKPSTSRTTSYNVTAIPERAIPTYGAPTPALDTRSIGSFSSNSNSNAASSAPIYLDRESNIPYNNVESSFFKSRISSKSGHKKPTNTSFELYDEYGRKYDHGSTFSSSIDNKVPSLINDSTIDDTNIALNAGKFNYYGASYKDIPFAVVFLANIFVTLFLGLFMFINDVVHPIDWNNTGPSVAHSIQKEVEGIKVIHWIIGPLICVLCSTIINFVFYGMLKRWSKFIIFLGYGIFMSFFLALSIVFFKNGALAGGITMLLISIIYGLIFLPIIKNITFTTTIMEECYKMVTFFPLLQVFLSLVCIFQTLLFSIWLVAFSTSTVFFATDSSNISIIILYVYLVFSLGWMAEVGNACLRLVIGGTLGVYFFYAKIVPTSKYPILPPEHSNPTKKAMKRALSTSFGSAAFGALLLNFVEVLQTNVRVIRIFLGLPILKYILFCVDWIFMAIERLLMYLSAFAYIRCAIYGESFFTASRRSGKMIKSRIGFDKIFNDLIIRMSLFTARTPPVVLSIIFGGMFSYFQVHADSTISGDAKLKYTIWMCAVSALCSYITARTITEHISGAITATYLCLTEHPQIVANKNPTFAMASSFHFKNLDYGSGFRL